MALSPAHLTPLLRQVRAVLVPELNMGQMSREVKRVNQGMTRIETLNRIDGNLITPGEILACRLEEMSGCQREAMPRGS